MGVADRARKKKSRVMPRPSLNGRTTTGTGTFRRLGIHRRAISILLLLSGVTFIAVLWLRRDPSSPPHISLIRVVNEYPHDPRAFTQGLVYAGNDTLYESTGLYSQSSVRRVKLHTGKVEHLHSMDASQFGEGLTLLDDRLYQVTWLTKTGFIYDKNNLSKIEQFSHTMQDGWGLATSGDIMFGSDGSSMLYLMDPKTLKVMKKHIITYNGHEVHNINELEFVNGEVWANIFLTDCIARISPGDGKVIGWVLLQNLRENLISSGKRGIDVLNGIAWDDVNGRIFVTGKLWPKLYEIELQPVEKTFEESIEQLCLPQPFHFP